MVTHHLKHNKKLLEYLRNNLKTLYFHASSSRYTLYFQKIKIKKRIACFFREDNLLGVGCKGGKIAYFLLFFKFYKFLLQTNYFTFSFLFFFKFNFIYKVCCFLLKLFSLFKDIYIFAIIFVNFKN